MVTLPYSIILKGGEYNIMNNKNNKDKIYIIINFKKILIFSIILLIIIVSFLSTLLRSDILFKLFPNIGILYSYKLTIKNIKNETDTFIDTFEKHLENSSLEKGNKLSVALPKTYLELIKYDNNSTLYIDFQDKFILSYFLDYEEFIFSINNKTNYSILLNNYFKKYYNQTSSLDYQEINQDKISFKYYFTNYIQNLEQDSRYEYIKSLLFKNKSIKVSSDHTNIVHRFSDEEFKYIVFFLTDYIKSNNIKVISRIIVTSFLDNADSVCITSTLKNSDKLGNVIRTINISVNNTNKSYFEINFLDEDTLLGKFNIKYKFLSFKNTLSFIVNFDTINNTFILRINNKILFLNFENSASSVIINSNNSNFIRISDDLSEIIKPTNKTILNMTPYNTEINF